MIVVSDTSSLAYFIAASQADLAARLFGTVVIPRAVEWGILDPHSPPSVQKWMEQRPTWLQKIREVRSRPDLELAKQLDLGEAEAIQLALELRADVLVMDERRGRQVAAARGITVIGVLGILRESNRCGFIGNPLAIAA